MSDVTQSNYVQTEALDAAFQQELVQLMALAKSSGEGHNQVKEAACYRLVLQYAPDHPDANFCLAKILFHTLQIEEALQHIEAAIRALPSNPVYWDEYVAILNKVGQQGLVDEAVKLRSYYISDNLISDGKQHTDEFQEIEFDINNLGVDNKNIKLPTNNVIAGLVNDKKSLSSEISRMTILFQRSEFKALEKFTKKTINKNKNNGITWKFNGLALLELANISGALISFENAVRILPNDAVAHFNLAICCGRLAHIALADHHYREAIRINPSMLEAYNNLGNLLRSNGQFDEAEACFRALIAQHRDFIFGYINLVLVLIIKRAYIDAKSIAIKAVQLNPAMAEAQNVLGLACYELKEFNSAVDHFLHAIELKPAYPDAYNNLGVVYFEMKQYVKARPYFEKYSEFNPAMSGPQRLLGYVSWNLNEPADTTLTYFRKAMEVNPNDNEANTAILFLLGESPACGAEQLFVEHRRFGERVERDLIAQWPKHDNDKTLDRCLRVGIVSGDFYNHAVATFILPILDYLKNNVSINLYAYANNINDDDVTVELKEKFHFWTKIHTLSDVEVVKKIQEDRIDILFDLSGHTAKNRLVVFAHKAAPVQISWIGYPGTTGLHAMDYYLTDRYFLPEGEFDQFFSEKLVRLPASAAFQPHERSPEVNPLPALLNGYVTFASFNRISKISRDVVAVWSRLLVAVPSSNFFLGGLPSDGNFQHLINIFKEYGIERDRLIFFGRCNIDIYLEQLQKVDICLDTFPYNGGTTTLHALWMGVPTLTKVGTTIAGRTGVCILSHVGLQKFAVRTDDDFVNTAIYWSKNLNELAGLRASLRNRLSASPLRDPNLIAVSVIGALRVMWQNWCVGLPTKSFEITSPKLSKK
ncbi:MAG: tetratricopeptide repeat protein [Glaciimonas sp.]|nr:tetratricopeptide repeat protein [Glaciimonas sp.]